MACNLNGGAVIGLRSIVSRGLWSVCTTVVFPIMYSLNFRVLNTIACISFSVGAQLISDCQSLRDAFAIVLRSAPSTLLPASHYIVTSFPTS